MGEGTEGGDGERWWSTEVGRGAGAERLCMRVESWLLRPRKTEERVVGRAGGEGGGGGGGGGRGSRGGDDGEGGSSTSMSMMQQTEQALGGGRGKARGAGGGVGGRIREARGCRGRSAKARGKSERFLILRQRRGFLCEGCLWCWRMERGLSSLKPRGVKE